MVDFLKNMGIMDANFDVWHIIVRLVLASIAGFVIGFERKKRLKDAGLKTHSILCITACLLMIISKYGFYDIASLPEVNFDCSRVASTIISGMCFLGAGMLFYKKDSLKGLTTAAGVCLTIAVGMTIGAGLIVTAFFITIFEIVLQILLHSNLKIFRKNYTSEYRAQFYVVENYMEEFKQKFNIKNFSHLKTFKQNEKIVADVQFSIENDDDFGLLINSLRQDENIIFIEKTIEN